MYPAMLRISGLKMELGRMEEELPAVVLSRLGLDSAKWGVGYWQIQRKSVDARDKARIHWVYTIIFSITKTNSGGAGDDGAVENMVLQRGRKRKLHIERYEQEEYAIPSRFPAVYDRAENKLARAEYASVNRPLVAGFGPCGIFCAYVLAKAGLRPVVIERGRPIGERRRDVDKFWQHGILNEDSNVLFGEGGAGAFSDGKLTTGIKDHRKPFVLETLAAAGGGDEIRYMNRPHIGTDLLRDVVGRLREDIIAEGGEVRFGNKLAGLVVDEKGALSGVELGDGEIVWAKAMALAIGHSARDTFRALYGAGLSMVQKPFSMGFRIEHAQLMIDENQYGSKFNDIYGLSFERAGLPRAEYQLSHHCSGGNGVYTFCMCPGGHVIAAASEEEGVFTNGMSYHARDGLFANSAVLAGVPVSAFGSGHPLAGLELQRGVEHKAYLISKEINYGKKNGYMPLSETLAELRSPESLLSGCLPVGVLSNIHEALPVFGRKIEGFDDDSVRVTGPETRSSSPVRIVRGDDLQGSIPGVYPCGEGSGHAGGIMSAAIDGIKVAEAIIKISKGA